MYLYNNLVKTSQIIYNNILAGMNILYSDC